VTSVISIETPKGFLSIQNDRPQAGTVTDQGELLLLVNRIHLGYDKGGIT
jgi:hypothetical protein